MELAVVGTPTFTLGFRLAGVRRTLNADTGTTLSDAVRRLLREPDIGVVVMETQDVAKLEANLRRELEASVRPTLVAIGVTGDTDLREKLKQAVGVDLWK